MGTAGTRKDGSAFGKDPISPTVRTSRPVSIVTAVRTIMHTSGEGIAFVICGRV
ncbi:hypothetical protein FQZ97_680500 [compost metagenome]